MAEGSPLAASRRSVATSPAAVRAAAMALLVLCFAGSAACARDEPALRVLSAASLTEVVEAAAAQHHGLRVASSFGGSSVLARQIRDGAPADVFLSASPAWIDFLRDAGALSGEPIVLARNRLVGITTRGGSLASRNVDGPGALLELLGSGGRVAIADEGVPAGEYARAALAELGLLAAFRPHLVGQRDVRAVLHSVEQGELAVGFVYATDAKLAAVDVLFVLDSRTPIEYQAAVVRGAARPDEARRFLDHLGSERTRALLTQAGFAVP